MRACYLFKKVTDESIQKGSSELSYRQASLFGAIDDSC
jgi:hypothetical protein